MKLNDSLSEWRHRAERAEAEVERQREFARNAWKQADAYREALGQEVVSAEERAERAEAEVELRTDEWMRCDLALQAERELADELAAALRVNHPNYPCPEQEVADVALAKWEEARR